MTTIIANAWLVRMNAEFNMWDRRGILYHLEFKIITATGKTIDIDCEPIIENEKINHKLDVNRIYKVKIRERQLPGRRTAYILLATWHRLAR